MEPVLNAVRPDLPGHGDTSMAQQPVSQWLAGQPHCHLIPPQDDLPFVVQMDRARLILTDSGDIQEEAPALGKPARVRRDTTERPESVAATTVKLVGTDTSTIVRAAAAVLDDAEAFARFFSGSNPHGDGHAAQRIREVMLSNFAA